MEKKRYTIKTACPQCGCTDLTVLTDQEIIEKYGDDPRVHMECGECTSQYEAEMADACPEWDKECKMLKK